MLSDKEFKQFCSLLHGLVIISMSDAKNPLVSSRLAKRIHQHSPRSYDACFHLLMREQHGAAGCIGRRECPPERG
ncbi:hypothetical protein [Aquipseudomonas alcaligenes]|uniref:hypothetical protein n=1 Tax=Aquipseudomonas alcaligenes TaxID=43263 RepID=UPI0016594B39|nr:hypothetical protein [Pseudomonas alcaligenes]